MRRRWGATGEDREEQDVDLAEAEDAREEVFQDELRKRIQGMRARLKEGKGGGRVKLTMGGEEIGIKVNDKSMVANQDDGGEENSEESDGDMDLMHDWTQFNT